MGTYRIVSDATLDLPQNVIENYGIGVIPMHFTLDEQEYTHYPDERELSMTAFYDRLREGKMPATSQVTPAMYEDFFKPILDEGCDIIYIALSSGLSGTYQSSRVAADMLMDQYEDRRITCIDSVCASIGEGLLVYQAAVLQEQGMSYEELAAWIEEHKRLVEHWFTVEDLFHLNRGGRLSAVGAVVGTALKIKPVLSVDNEGKLYVASKIRGMKRSIEFLISQLSERGIDTKSQLVIVGHGDNPEMAEYLRDFLMENELVKDVLISGIGPVIGTHTGPGMVALTFMGSPRAR